MLDFTKTLKYAEVITNIRRQIGQNFIDLVQKDLSEQNRAIEEIVREWARALPGSYYGFEGIPDSDKLANEQIYRSLLTLSIDHFNHLKQVVSGTVNNTPKAPTADEALAHMLGPQGPINNTHESPTSKSYTGSGALGL